MIPASTPAAWWPPVRDDIDGPGARRLNLLPGGAKITSYLKHRSPAAIARAEKRIASLRLNRAMAQQEREEAEAIRLLASEPMLEERPAPPPGSRAYKASDFRDRAGRAAKVLALMREPKVGACPCGEPLPKTKGRPFIFCGREVCRPKWRCARCGVTCSDEAKRAAILAGKDETPCEANDCGAIATWRQQTVCAGWEGPCLDSRVPPETAFEPGWVRKRSGEPWRCRACAQVKGKARLSPEQLSAASRKANAAMTPEQRAARTRAMHAALTPTIRSAAVRQGRQAMSADRRREIGIKGKAGMSAEARREAAHKAWATKRKDVSS